MGPSVTEQIILQVQECPTEPELGVALISEIAVLGNLGLCLFQCRPLRLGHDMQIEIGLSAEDGIEERHRRPVAQYKSGL